MGKGNDPNCTGALLAMPLPAQGNRVTIDEQWARDLYGRPSLGVLSDVHTCVGNETYLVLNGGLRDAETGDPMGGWSRQLNLRDDGWEAYHARLKVVEAYRGRGIAGALLAQQEHAYRAAGIKRILMTAQWHGAAFWPTQEFEPDDVEECRHTIWSASRKVLDDNEDWINGRGDLLADQLLADGRISPELYEQARALFWPQDRSEPLIMADAVRLGQDAGWQTKTGRQMWLGRALVSGAEYEARKLLT
jgi:GNAT superfamily N-acetyltransferase